MSVLLQELVGNNVKLRTDEEFTGLQEYSILAVDEDWLKVSRPLGNGETETRLLRVDSISDVRY